MDNQELLPCPFCGSDARTIDNTSDIPTWAQCRNHGRKKKGDVRCVMSHTIIPIAAWNRRAAPQVAVPADYAFRSRVADMLHLLEFATITTPSNGDAVQAERAMDDVKSMLAARPAAPTSQSAGDAWLPIETAPKDGRAILVMRDIWPGTSTGRAEECNAHNTYVAAWWGDCQAGEWTCYMDAVHDPACPIDPTHWCHLPSPPIAAIEAERAGEVR